MGDGLHHDSLCCPALQGDRDPQTQYSVATLMATGKKGLPKVGARENPGSDLRTPETDPVRVLS